MNHYELAYVLDPDLSQEELASTSQAFASLISEQGASVKATASWGKRRLAFEINKKHEGCYFFVQFDSEADVLAELNRQLRLSDKVMRHMIIRLDERFLEEAALPAEQVPLAPQESEKEPLPEAEVQAQEESEAVPVVEAEASDEAGEAETEAELSETEPDEVAAAEPGTEEEQSEGDADPAGAETGQGEEAQPGGAVEADTRPEAG